MAFINFDDPRRGTVKGVNGEEVDGCIGSDGKFYPDDPEQAHSVQDRLVGLIGDIHNKIETPAPRITMAGFRQAGVLRKRLGEVDPNDEDLVRAYRKGIQLLLGPPSHS